MLTERGDGAAVVRHEGFRLFAAMNPATDAGKRDLPSALRNHFTEFWVSEPTQREDLAAIVDRYVSDVDTSVVDGIVDFYQAAKREADSSLQDGAGHRPAYNLRTLCRALEFCAAASPTYGLARSLAEGLDMSFATQLDQRSASRVRALIGSSCLGGRKVEVSEVHVRDKRRWCVNELSQPGSSDRARDEKQVHSRVDGRSLAFGSCALHLFGLCSHPSLCLLSPSSTPRTSAKT